MDTAKGRRLLDPDLHDGHLSGIVVNGTTLELLCSTMEGVGFVLRLTDLDRLRADNFLEGNIILDITIYETAFPEELILRVFGLDKPPSSDWFQKQMNELSASEWTLLELLPSYGCELLALANGRLTIQKSE